MNIDASGNAGSSNICSCSSKKTATEATPSILCRYQATLDARALHSEAERVQMLLRFADMETQIDRVAERDAESTRASLHAAKLRVMHSSVVSTIDLAVKVLVAAEDGFGTRQINEMLEHDAQRIIAANI